MTMYEVIRFSQKPSQTVVRTGMTLQEAQKLCSDPETSSMTAKKPKGCEGDPKMIERWHEDNKHWFYGYRSYEA